ncbi:MAG: cyclic nucleotide-binding domain-containing protein [Gammaproteobacteria bacterium]|nr:cyclic nucleotide-binding domain-containing protein [Gammaproteobacteria bacterium]
MSGAKEFLQVKFLKTLEPLSSLSVDKLEEIANKSQVEELPPGRVIFRQGEKDSRCIYLLSGQLELQVTGNPRTETLKAKSADTRYPVAQEWPRPSTCRTKTNAVLLHIDSNLLEILLSDDPSGRYEVSEIGVEEDADSDWMLRFLQSPAFLRLPTDNIQKLLIKLEEHPIKSGQAVVTQGDSDDYYYIVKQGKFVVSRRPAPKLEEVRLAVLGPGDGFGEEALITHGKRNATVTAKEDGVLMRLNKKDFHELLVQPMLVPIDHASMMEKLKAGAALIDVRTNKEFNDNGIKGALNIPLSMLRVKAKDLNATREHIVYCNDASLSSAAAFLLAQQSLQVYVLAGGLNGQQKTFSPAPAVAPVKPEKTPPILQEAVPPPVLDKVATKPTAPVAEDVFHAHKRQAQQQAQRANEAESVRKQAEEKTAQLRQEADALRAQADRLASRTANAEAERQKAENEIRRIKEDTLKQRDEILASAKIEVAREKEKAKQTEQEISQLKQQAEEAQRRAEEELARIKREADSVGDKQRKLDDEYRRAEEEKQKAARAAEVARIMAKQEADKVKAEAEAIRQEALQEAERLKQEMLSRKAKMEAEDAARHEAALNEARRKAENAIQEAAKAAEEARSQAEMEAQSIRKQALQEAERLRTQLEREKQQAAEAAARAKAEEALRLQELETAHRKAMDDARRQAQLEAENFRKQAFEEARLNAHEESRRLVELEAATLRQKTFEEVQRQAMETARLQAEQAAEAIRREALEEANRLREELESTRQLIETETLRAKAKIEEEEARRKAEEDALARAAEESARRAAEEAERRRAEDARRRQEEETRRAEEARRREAEAETRRKEEARRRAAEEEQRLAAEVHRLAQEEEKRREESARAKVIAEERRQEAARRLKQAQEAQREHELAKAREAEKLAISLKNRMTEKSARKNTDDFSYVPGNGLKLSKAKLHITKDKTILEGEEDIFVFKAPSERPPTREEAEKLLKEAEAQFKEKKDLPSFDLQYADDDAPGKTTPQDTGFSDSVVQDLGNLTAISGPQSQAANSIENDEFTIPEDVKAGHKPRNKRSLIALAASVLIMIAVSVIVITRPTYIDKDVVAAWTDGDQPQQKTAERGLASLREQPTTDARALAEDRVKAQADTEFNQLLSKWRKDNKKETGSN